MRRRRGPQKRPLPNRYITFSLPEARKNRRKQAIRVKINDVCRVTSDLSVRPRSGVRNRRRSPVLHERQSPMKNLEVSFSLLELKFKCKNLFLMWEKHLGARI